MDSILKQPVSHPRRKWRQTSAQHGKESNGHATMIHPADSTSCSGNRQPGAANLSLQDDGGGGRLR